MGEGLGVRALFQWKFMALILVHIVCRSKLSMNLSFGNSRLGLLTPHPDPLPVEAVEGRGSRSLNAR
jgi:hypothetical protein